MSQPKLLLVSPVFHGYWKTIATSIEKLGYEVFTHLYDAPGTLVERVQNKILHDLPERFRPASLEGEVTRAAIDQFKKFKPDIVLVVRGDQLGTEWWQMLNDSGVRHAVWLYDELRRMRFSQEDLTRLGPIASYSPEDVKSLVEKGFQAIEVPLAFDTNMGISSETEPNISFVGARYEGREKMLRAMHEAGIPVRAYGKQWSRHPWDIARTRNFSAPGIPVGRDLDRSRAYGIMAASPATLNIHGDQDGFTMRTFEAPGVGGLQIVDRTEVNRYYDLDTEVLAYTSLEELIEISHRVLEDSVWAKNIQRAGQKRTLAEHTFDERVKSLEILWA